MSNTKFQSDESFVIERNWSFVSRDRLPQYDYSPTSKTKGSNSRCFNCMSNEHVVSSCPQQINYLIVKYNELKRRQISDSLLNRYHVRDKSPTLNTEPGNVSNKLRRALGLKNDEVPPFIRKMKQFGYPLGHLHASIYKDILNKSAPSSTKTHDQYQQTNLEDGEIEEDDFEEDAKFDLNKFIKFPGFNTSSKSESDAPVDVKNECTHSLEEMIKLLSSKNKLFDSNTSQTSDDDEGKIDDLIDNPVNDSKNVFRNDSPEKSEYISGQNVSCSISSTPKSNSQKESKLPKTPILNMKIFKTVVPSLDNFSKGMPDLVNFENLPNTTGTYKTIKSAIDNLRNNVKTDDSF